VFCGQNFCQLATLKPLLVDMYLSLVVGIVGMTSVAKGPKFPLHNSIGAEKKAEGPEKVAAEFLPDLHKKGRKGAEFFQDHYPMGNLWIF
jgi:hypothetical protein